MGEHTAENGLPELMARAEAWVAMESSSHLREKDGMGCICGFCVWSPEHVAVMSFRDGLAAFLAHERVSPPVAPSDALRILTRNLRATNPSPEVLAVIEKLEQEA